MAADVDPSFAVATIKPNNSGDANLRGLGLNGRNFETRNSSLVDLIAFAYAVQAKQITNGPSWMESERYDITAVPEQQGIPNVGQLSTMAQKLLADRFKLAFHIEKRELPAYVLSAAKNGQKLTPAQSTGPFPEIRFRPGASGLTLTVRDMSMARFAQLLQIMVLDRPVVNQTAIDGTFDFQVTFTPDSSQFNGHPPGLSQMDAAAASPGLFDAVQQQLGLKLNAEKTQVDVLVVDHVEKPSPN